MGGYTPSFTRKSARSRPESGSGRLLLSRRSGGLNFRTSAGSFAPFESITVILAIGTTSAVTSATAGLARRMASWTLSATTTEGSASHAVARSSAATTALMPSPTYHGRMAGTMARPFLFSPFLGLPVALRCHGLLAILSERLAQVSVGFGEVWIEA